jgi:rod shape determining protein RodA
MMGRDRPDLVLILAAAAILVMGLMTVFSASRAVTDEGLFGKQVLWTVIGSLFFAAGTWISFRRLEEIAPFFFVTACLLLVATLFFGSGPAHRWLVLGPLRFQASELAKASLVLMTAWWLSSLRVKPRRMGEMLVFLTVLPAVVMTAVQPDLGTSVSMILVVLCMFIWAGYGPGWIFLIVSPATAAISSTSFGLWLGFTAVLAFVLFRRKATVMGWILIIGGNALVAALTPMAWNVLEPYQQSRLLTFLNPAADPHGAGWNIIQSEVAVGSGGIFGQGYLQGAQKELAFLPARHTDFVFSVWAEETGLLGSLLLLTAFMLLIWRITKAARKSVNPFNSLVASGVAAYLAIHVFVNVGMTLGVMPVTGIPLPMMSYGGTQMMVVMFLLGLAVNAGMYWREV